MFLHRVEWRTKFEIHKLKALKLKRVLSKNSYCMPINSETVKFNNILLIGMSEFLKRQVISLSSQFENHSSPCQRIVPGTGDTAGSKPDADRN